MTVLCFSGPSLSPNAAQRLFPEAHCLPPAAQGDVYGACRTYGPSTICLVDGFFEHRPAVSHKELLWALSEGIAVYGAASMGALRAIELAPYGMLGFGSVYQWYATGAIEDDDEVAVVHADASLEFRVHSDALVNLRATLDAACASDILSAGSRAALIARARETFYAERSYARLVSDAASLLPRSESDALAAWLSNPDRRTDVKRRDARGLLEHVRALQGVLAPSGKVPFEETDSWLSIRRTASARKLGADAPIAHEVTLAELIEEVQMAGESMFDEVVRVATWRTLCLTLAGGDEANGGADLEARTGVRDDAVVDAFGPLAHQRVYRCIPGALRVLGLDAALTRRAQAKRALRPLAEQNCTDPTDALDTYFRLRLARGVPAELDDYAQRVGFAECDAFLRALAVEVAHLRAETGTK